MNSPKVVVSLGLALIFSVILTACGGGSKAVTPPAGPPTLETKTLPQGAVNKTYNAILSAIGGTGFYTWTITSGSLPPGLTLSSTQGIISGTPTALGTYPFTAQVTDAKGLSSTANLSIYIQGVVVASSTCGASSTPNVCPSGSVNVPYTNPDGSPVQVTATGGVPPYTWTISSSSGSLPAGLSLDPKTCTNSSVPCIISGTPTAPGAPTPPFTLQVADSETPVAAVSSSSFSIAVMQVTSSSLPQGSAGIPYSTTLTASGGVPYRGGTYNWCVLGASGACDPSQASLPPGLSLSSTGVLSGTPTTINTFNFMVQASDNETPPAKASGTVSLSIIAVVTNANLSGNYVFTFSGYINGSPATPVMMAGSFSADGQGHISYGLLDYNDGQGETTQNGDPVPQIISGSSTYSISPNGLGTMTLVTNLSPPSYVFNLAITTDGSGRLIQSDKTQPQVYGSGALMKHNPLSSGEQWPLCGSPVAAGLFGVDSSLTTRYAAAGQFQFNPSSCVDFVSATPVGMDIDDGGAASSATFTGAFNQYDYINTRGYTGITFKPGGVHTYAFYLISSADHKQNQLVLLSTDPASQPAPLTLWSVLQQSNPPTGWDNTALTGTAVAELNALDNNVTPDVTAGLFVGNGGKGNTCQGNNYDPATFNFDENQGGTAQLQQTSAGTYCVDATTGRVTLTTFSMGPFVTPPVFYMVKGEQAFVVGTDSAVTSGILEPQTGLPPFSTKSIMGLYSGGTETPVSSTVTNAVASMYADGSANINGTENTSGPGGPQGPLLFNYVYTVDSSTGRAVVQQSGSPVAVIYVVGSAGSQTTPAKAVMLPLADSTGKPDANPALSIFGHTTTP